MPGFDLDMAFTAVDLVAGLERLLDKQGHSWQRSDAEEGSVFRVKMASGHTVEMTVGPLPAARATYVSFFPRALLVVCSADASSEEIAALRHAVVMAFLRVTG
jgi:hypothetical protein